MHDLIVRNCWSGISRMQDRGTLVYDSGNALIYFDCDQEGHYSTDKNCPARNETCNKCKRVGHFAVVYKTGNERSPENKFRSGNAKSRGGYKQKHKGRVQAVDEDESGDACAFNVKDADKEGQGRIDVAVGGIPLRMLIDSGAVTHIVDRDTWETLKSSRIMCDSYKCDRKLYAYESSNPLPVLGRFTAKVKLTHTDETEGEFIVIDESGQPLLGRETATELGVLKLGVNSIREYMIDEFPECFKGVGKLRDYKVKLHVKDDVKPIIQPLRRPPYSLRNKIEDKLVELEELDIIEKVDSPSAWVSPLVVVPKVNKDARLCVDMRRANEAVERERYPIPTIEEVMQDLNKGKVFSKLDLKWGLPPD